MSVQPPESSSSPDPASAGASTRQHESRWRLLTSADNPKAARAAARSLLAGLLVRDEVELGVAPWFKGGTSVEFFLRHDGSRGQALAEIRRMVTRTCVEHEVIAEGDSVVFWSGALNVPRAETLEVRLVEDDG